MVGALCILLCLFAKNCFGMLHGSRGSNVNSKDHGVLGSVQGMGLCLCIGVVLVLQL